MTNSLLSQTFSGKQLTSLNTYTSAQNGNKGSSFLRKENCEMRYAEVCAVLRNVLEIHEDHHLPCRSWLSFLCAFSDRGLGCQMGTFSVSLTTWSSLQLISKLSHFTAESGHGRQKKPILLTDISCLEI